MQPLLCVAKVLEDGTLKSFLSCLVFYCQKLHLRNNLKIQELTKMAIETLQKLLEFAAESQRHRGLIVYLPGSVSTPCSMTYEELRLQALHNAQLLRRIDGLTQGTVILLHFDNHLDNIVWLWSVLNSGYLPAMSTPFSNDPRQREKHLSHLYTLLKDPFCITRQDSIHVFAGSKTIRVEAVENLNPNSTPSMNGTKKMGSAQTPFNPHDRALLMLTSGSTGNAKAVVLRHDQVIASIAGKASARQLPRDHAFLNWIGLDHVAGMLEIHLQAMYLCVDQIHVQAADLIANPVLFVNLIDKHRVSRSFAPNFFFSRLRRALELENAITRKLDLSCLRFLGSGGEANSVETCSAVSKLLSAYGAPEDIIVPGFGMTETCAGAIYNIDCPRHNLQNDLEFAGLGSCMPGIKMRITVSSKPRPLANPGECGDLEVTGPVVFAEYFNDKKATADAFTDDGWFKTGDQALLDFGGNLNLVGRGKEQMIINGVKYSPHEVEAALEEASIAGVTPNYSVCFSHRPRNSETEHVCVVYLPAYAPDDGEARIQALETISRTVMLQTSVRPYVLPLDHSLLQKSTLGKLSRSKIRKAFESGQYKMYQEVNDAVIKKYKTSHATPPANETEELLLREFEDVLELPKNEFGTETHVFEIGATSIDLIRVTRAIEKRLNLTAQIPISTMMTHPTVRSLAIALKDLHTPKEFDPVITLQNQGTKTPLWLIHPGVGEVLVFLPLAKFFPDRPVHAIRARGFNPGESHFQHIPEAVTIYHAAMKRQQPTGPYAIAGYSYGSMLAFELAKVIERNGDEVRFLASFNLPPHIKTRMRQLNWTECLLNLAYFLDLISEQKTLELSPLLHDHDRSQALDHVVRVAAPARMKELSLTSDALANWTGVAFSLQSMAREYEPRGMVEAMDVFYCVPLKAVASSKEEWLRNQLSKWEGFCRTEVRFHDVGGAHYTMIGSEHVGGFQETLRLALRARGV